MIDFKIEIKNDKLKEKIIQNKMIEGSIVKVIYNGIEIFIKTNSFGLQELDLNSDLLTIYGEIVNE
jgi:hypothetical protein